MTGKKEKRIRFAIFLVIISILTITIIAYRHTERVKFLSQKINYTKEILLGLNDLYKTVITHAGSVRNYALSGNPQDTDSANITAQLLSEKLTKLEKQMHEDTARHGLGDSIRKYIDRRIEHSTLIIKEYREKGLESAAALYQIGAGREYNNAIFYFINQLQTLELERLQLNEHKYANAGRNLSAYTIGLFGFIMTLTFFIIQKIRLDRAEQKKSEKRLKKFNETLESQVTRKTKEIEHINYLLNERIKELTTLHKVSQLLQAENTTVSELLQKIVTILPGGWQYVDNAAACISWGADRYYSAGYRDSKFKQSASFQSFDGKVGSITVVYFEKKPHEAEGPFSAEERNMLNTLAEMLQTYFNRKLAEDRLTQSYQEIRLLASHIEKAREDEKIRISREIHDDLGQQLTGLKMDVSWLGDKFGKNDEVFGNKITEMKQLLDEIVRSVRRIASDLRPGILDDLGLVAAIKWQSDEFQKRYGISTRFKTTSGDLELPNNVSTGLFRIFQESLTNVARHSNAKHVSASLDILEDKLVLKISDDGVGFNVTNIGQKRTLGLLGMKERTALMGGTYEVVSNEGRGTSVEVSVPIEA